MRKILAVSVLLNIVLVIVALWPERRATAVGGAGLRTATENGDTNGDGGIDVTDAVYLLNWLFTGGAEIAVLDCPETQSRSCLVGTGQVDCFGTTSVIECTNPRARGQDAYYRHGCPPEGRFVDNGDGTVSDNCTGLTWTKKNVDVDNDGEIRINGDPSTPGPDQKVWLEACQFADDMSFAGHDDWRVPNVQELLSIIDFSRAAGSLAPPFAPFIFETTWSSTHVIGGRALGLQLFWTQYGCDCCTLTFADNSHPNVFVAVRGSIPE